MFLAELGRKRSCQVSGRIHHDESDVQKLGDDYLWMLDLSSCDEGKISQVVSWGGSGTGCVSGIWAGFARIYGITWTLTHSDIRVPEHNDLSPCATAP